MQGMFWDERIIILWNQGMLMFQENVSFNNFLNHINSQHNIKFTVEKSNNNVLLENPAA